MRDRFVHKLNKGLKSLRLPLGYLSIFALAGIEPRKEIRLQVHVFEQNDLADFNIKIAFASTVARLQYLKLL